MTDYWGSWSLYFVLDYISHKKATSDTAEILIMMIKTALAEFLWGNEAKTLSKIFHLFLDLVRSIFYQQIFEWVNFFPLSYKNYDGYKSILAESLVGNEAKTIIFFIFWLWLIFYRWVFEWVKFIFFLL